MGEPDSPCFCQSGLGDHLPQGQIPRPFPRDRSALSGALRKLCRITVIWALMSALLQSRLCSWMPQAIRSIPATSVTARPRARCSSPFSRTLKNISPASPSMALLPALQPLICPAPSDSHLFRKLSPPPAVLPNWPPRRTLPLNSAARTRRFSTSDAASTCA